MTERLVGNFGAAHSWENISAILMDKVQACFRIDWRPYRSS